MFTFSTILASSPTPGSETLQAEINYALTFVPTYAMVLIRVASMFIFAPLFGSGRIPRPLKAGMACVFALCLTPSVAPVALPDNIYFLTIGIACEIMFGLAMGMIMSLVFVAAQWAGEIIGQQLGFNIGAVFDPQFGAAGSVISDLLFMMTLVIFLCIGGHHAMLLGLQQSFDRVPLLAVTGMNTISGLSLLAGLLGACTVLVAKLIAPTIASMLLADVVLGFISKTMPQLNVMSAGMSIRALLGIFVVAAGLMLTNDIMRSAVEDSMYNVRRAWVTPWSSFTPDPRLTHSKPPADSRPTLTRDTEGGASNG